MVPWRNAKETLFTKSQLGWNRRSGRRKRRRRRRRCNPVEPAGKTRSNEMARNPFRYRCRGFCLSETRASTKNKQTKNKTKQTRNGPGEGTGLSNEKPGKKKLGNPRRRPSLCGRSIRFGSFFLCIVDGNEERNSFRRGREICFVFVVVAAAVGNKRISFKTPKGAENFVSFFRGGRKRNSFSVCVCVINFYDEPLRPHFTAFHWPICHSWSGLFLLLFYLRDWVAKVRFARVFLGNLISLHLSAVPLIIFRLFPLFLNRIRTRFNLRAPNDGTDCTGFYWVMLGCT